MSRRNEVLPVILGMNPPTKEVLLMRTFKPLNGFACVIRRAEFPKEIECGDGIPMSIDIKHGGVCAWIQFKDKEVMRKFGQMILEFADTWEGEE